MIPSVSINLIAVVAATIVSMVIGMVWYSQLFSAING